MLRLFTQLLQTGNSCNNPLWLECLLLKVAIKNTSFGCLNMN